MKKIVMLFLIMSGFSCMAEAPKPKVPDWINGKYYYTYQTKQYYQKATDYSFKKHEGKVIKYIKYNKKARTIVSHDDLTIYFTDGSKLVASSYKYLVKITE